jgi:suppressor of G2 allele of SKP1
LEEATELYQGSIASMAEGTGATEDLTAEQSLNLGDSHYVDENFGDAIDAFAAALSVLRESETLLHFRILSHRSSAFYQLGRYEEALEDAKQAAKLVSCETPVSGLRPGESELVYRREGLAALKLERYPYAVAAMETAAQLASLNKRDTLPYKRWIRQCEEHIQATATPAQQATASTVAPVVVEDPAAIGTGTGTDADADAAVVMPTIDPVAIDAITDAAVVIPTAAAAQVPVAATTTPVPASFRDNGRPLMPKYQYYQSDKVMTISILEANVAEEDLRVTFESQRLQVVMTKGGVDFTVIAGTLYDEIDVPNSRVNIRAEKVLIKLRKTKLYEWHELLGKETKKPSPPAAAAAKQVPEVDTAKPRPYASTKDWNAIEKNVVKEEENEKPEGDEAMNKLFQQIYSSADEETRRAMIKSYQTSGGTVLSTNWNEVKEKDYETERTAPKGMEWKNWEGDKLPQQDD